MQINFRYRLRTEELEPRLVLANFIEQLPFLLADDPTAGAGDNYGWSVDIDGDRAVVGARGNDGLASDAGAAYVLERQNGFWTQTARLDATGTSFNASDSFGFDVAISGDTIVVGSRFDDEFVSNAGAAYVFVYDGSDWNLQQKLSASDPESSDQFGSSVDIEGNTIVVGALFEDQVAQGAGAAYVFERTGTVWQAPEKLVAADGGSNDLFGTDVAISGNRLVIGAPYYNAGAISEAGAAYVFEQTPAGWVQDGLPLLANDRSASDRFGYSVDIDNNYVVVGAYGDDDHGQGSGSAYVFNGSTGVWQLEDKLTDNDDGTNDAQTSDLFGEDVAIDGDTIAISVPRDNSNNRSGSATVFRRLAGGDWQKQQKLYPFNASFDDRFGEGIALDGETILLGGPENDALGNSAGAVAVWEDTLGDDSDAVHAFLERISRSYVYDQQSPGATVDLGFDYVVDREFTTGTTGDGLYALGLTSPTRNPVLAFRGTEPISAYGPVDVIADFDARGVGYDQYQSGRNDILGWLDGWSMAGTAVSITGHSLGGALTQWVAADFASQGGLIDEVVTFNSPGIERDHADMFPSTLADSVRHYITDGDIVSLAGEAFLAGGYTLSKFSDLNLINNHVLPVLNESIGDRERPTDLTRNQHEDVSWLNSPLFAYTDPDYFAWLIALQQATLLIGQYETIPMKMAFRFSTENFRSDIGQVFDDLASSANVDANLTNEPLTITLPDLPVDFVDRPAPLFPVELSSVAVTWTQMPEPSLRLQGSLTLPKVFNASADFSGDNYVELRPDGIDVVGELRVPHVTIAPGLWSLHDLFVSINTVTQSVTAGGELKIPTGERIVAEMGFSQGELDMATLGVFGLNVPIFSTGFFMQDIVGGVQNLAPSNAVLPLFSGEIGITGGPEFTVPLPNWLGGSRDVSVLAADILGSLDGRHVHGEADVGLFAYGEDDDENPTGFVNIEGDASYDWLDNTFAATGQLSILDGLATLHTSLSVSEQFDVSARGVGEVTIPKDFGFFGGASLLQGEALIEFTNDDLYSNDFIAAWIDPPLIGPKGIRIGFDGTVSPLGGKEIKALTAESTSFDVQPGANEAVFSAAWENDLNDLEFVLTMPNGTILTEADFAAHPSINVIPEFSDQRHRLVAIQGPDAGNWTVSMTDKSNVTGLEIRAMVDSESPTLSFLSIQQPSPNEVQISYDASDADSDAYIVFYADDDADGFDGVAISPVLVEQDTQASYTWDASSFLDADYYLYATIVDEHNVPQSSYSVTSITVEQPGVAGTIWFDTNHDNVVSKGERGLAGVVVYVDLNGNMQLDAGEPTAVSRNDDLNTAIDEEGQYKLTAPPIGTLELRTNELFGFVTTLPNGSQDIAYTPGDVIPNANLGIGLGDSNGDKVIDDQDIDQLAEAIRSGVSSGLYDLDDSENVDSADIAFLVETVLGTRFGDANLDGSVDGEDFIRWSSNKFTANPAWSAGDFNADGFVDGRDFLIWNSNKSTTTDTDDSPGHAPYSDFLSRALNSTRQATRVGRGLVQFDIKGSLTAGALLHFDDRDDERNASESNTNFIDQIFSQW